MRAGVASCTCPDGYYLWGSNRCLPFADGDSDADSGRDDRDTATEEGDDEEGDGDSVEEEQCLTCFHDTGLLCNPEPEVGQAAVIVNNATEPDGKHIISSPVFVTDNWIYYLVGNEGISPIRGELRACNRETDQMFGAYSPQDDLGAVYRDDTYGVVSFWHASQGKSSLSLCSFDDYSCNLLYATFDATSPFYRYPYFLYFDGNNAERLTVYSIPDKTTRALSGLANPIKYLLHDGRRTAVTMIPEAIQAPETIMSLQAWSSWLVDLDTLTYRPLSASVLTQCCGATDGRFVAFADQRDALPSGGFSPANGAIYLFDTKYKREWPITDSLDRDQGNTALEYPYVAYQYGPRAGTGGGYLEAQNIETGETWQYDAAYNDSSFSKNILQDRMLTSYTTGNEVVLFKLPAAGRIPADISCEDTNPCTDDRYSVTHSRCEQVYNHDRCDDGNSDTPFDVCVSGVCTGLALGSDDVPMATIPAGAFVWGSDEYTWEGPRRTATLPGYQIDIHEVTNAQYKRCVTAHACAEPKRLRSGRIEDYYSNSQYDDYPVLYVDWFEARNYCNWVGKRLPTEDEWVKAARGADDARDYPWGDHKPDATSRETNVCYEYLGMGEILDALEVMTYPQDVSPYGVYDMGGNVNEWTASEFSASGLDGAATWGADMVVVKGGAWRFGPQDERSEQGTIDVRAYMTPWSPTMYTGFRCVK